MSAAKRRDKRRPTGWQRVRIYFRRFRITVLLVLFVLVCIGAYLNQIGLPDFVKRPLLANLRGHGVDLEFSRLRLRGYRGIVAENVRLAGMENPAMPGITAQSADVKLNYAALARLELDIQGVTLHKGCLRWPLNPTNAPPHELVISNLMANVRFLPGNQWNLDRVEADYLGARFSVVGQITNAPALTARLKGKDKQPPEAFLTKLRRIHEKLEQIQFAKPPQFRLSFNGDGRNLASFNGVITIDAPDATTPWGGLQGAQLTARFDGSVLDERLQGELTLSADHVQTEWASLKRLQFKSNASQISSNEVQGTASLQAGGISSRWADAERLEIRADWKHRPHELKPHSASATIQARQLATRWAHADAVTVTVNGHPTSDWMAMNDPALGPWNQLLPYALQIACAATNVTARQLHADSLGWTARWDAPRLVVTHLHGQLAGGRAQLDAELDVLTRKLSLDGRADLDFHKFNPILTDKSRAWLDNFTWEQAPSVAMRGSLTLPAWTNRAPDWRGEVQPTVVLAGNVSLTNGSYRGISALSADTHLNYSNRVWRLPDLTLVRPEGTLRVDLQSDEVSHDYSIKLQGRFDPRALASQMDEKGRRGLGYFEFTEAPWLDGEVRGRWYERERTWARAAVAWTNLTYRGQHADRLEASLEYSNQVLQVFHPVVQRGLGRATADGISFDFATHKAYLTNGYSDTDPMAIARVIGPKVAAAVEPYHFVEPPVVRVYGVIPLQGERDADLHFDLSGGPFHWSKFKVPKISGQVHWANESVTLTNIETSFYGGEARGNAWFDVSGRGSTPFNFNLKTMNADLNALMADLHSPTNHLEGTLTGELVITDANTTNWNTWNGYGRASLSDGLIWDSPIFGIMSSIMNSVVPGIGNSRASAAGGTFQITNSIIHTRDLDIRASGMRLLYNGTVDFQTHVNARVEAELLRDTWFVGKLVSTALWPVSKLFEYKVTGTLADPRPEPVNFVPRLFLAPLQPFKYFKDMLQQPETPGDYDALPEILLEPVVPEKAAPNSPAEK